VKREYLAVFDLRFPILKNSNRKTEISPAFSRYRGSKKICQNLKKSLTSPRIGLIMKVSHYIQRSRHDRRKTKPKIHCPLAPLALHNSASAVTVFRFLQRLHVAQ
jgi:hypothetical protein